ncbi:hypothetical protein Pst134EA_017355 [Puccinia striiformis f. sp. tritici]|uniref:hypothetical protein n=1 Tax=Puccinia striiformis f. sp. tritici TaxID=168172 RepID=UPI002008C50E|nr:hypothetical protein Pst134EA_017355 [Puccinia striiformis f. sp. tritici]KAH9450751.1 hypothetical protein Pst134EB_018270 [Puccinia striiformis f. sp. tritici]KAH9461046.1 hypothetical protein Pst134EA_017355 [Puccinia striiformis f. sp. tritici]
MTTIFIFSELDIGWSYILAQTVDGAHRYDISTPLGHPNGHPTKGLPMLKFQVEVIMQELHGWPNQIDPLVSTSPASAVGCKLRQPSAHLSYISPSGSRLATSD